MAERMTMTSLEQLRVVADPYRLRILRMLREEELTTKMVSDALGDVPGKVHYHIKELQRLGFIKLVRKQEKGGVLEKYYRAVAKEYEPDLSLLRIQDNDDAAPQHVGLATRMRDEFIHASDRRLREEQAAEGSDGPLITFDVGDQFYLTAEQVREMHAFITNMLDEARKSGKQSADDRQQYTVGLFIYPTPSQQG